MPTTALVSVEEYLHSTFEPDAEYLEGKIVPRSAPQKPHSKTQGYLNRTLHWIAHPLGYEVWVEQRVRTQADPPRYRVPDVCVTFGEPDEDIFTAPPFLCVEILSPDDTVVDVRAKCVSTWPWECPPSGSLTPKPALAKCIRQMESSASKTADSRLAKSSSNWDGAEPPDHASAHHREGQRWRTVP